MARLLDDDPAGMLELAAAFREAVRGMMRVVGAEELREALSMTAAIDALDAAFA